MFGEFTWRKKNIFFYQFMLFWIKYDNKTLTHEHPSQPAPTLTRKTWIYWVWIFPISKVGDGTNNWSTNTYPKICLIYIKIIFNFKQTLRLHSYFALNKIYLKKLVLTYILLKQIFLDILFLRKSDCWNLFKKLQHLSYILILSNFFFSFLRLIEFKAKTILVSLSS